MTLQGSGAGRWDPLQHDPALQLPPGQSLMVNQTPGTRLFTPGQTNAHLLVGANNVV